MSATLQLNKKDSMLYVSLQFRESKIFLSSTLVHFKEALSEAELCRILTAHPAVLLQELPDPEFKVQIDNGNMVPVRKQVLLRFFIGRTNKRSHNTCDEVSQPEDFCLSTSNNNTNTTFILNKSVALISYRKQRHCIEYQCTLALNYRIPVPTSKKCKYILQSLKPAS